MRLSCLALLLLVLPDSPASAQGLPLADSLVVGAWDFNTEEWPLDTSVEGEIRFAGFFTPQHTFEIAMWAKHGGASNNGEVFKGLHMTGTWFIRDTSLGMIPATCTGFTEPGREECEIEADELGDTDYVSLQYADLPVLGRSRIMTPAEGWRIPLWRYEGPVRDMSEPDFWEGPTLALRRDGHPVFLAPGSDPGSPAFDVLGRMPAGRAPVRLYPGPAGLSSRASSRSRSGN